jgi:hypothetical protein
MSWLKNIGQKAIHGLAPAVGAVLPLLVGGPISWVMVAKSALGAFVGYMCKPARAVTPPAVTP